MDHCGMDLGTRESQIAILTEAGELIDRRIRTERTHLQDFFCGRPRMRILMEAGTESEWIARCIEATGHEVIVADPNYAPMYSQRSRKVKTDRRDAHGLAEACRLGAYRLAHRTSDEQRHVRALVAAREALVRSRAKLVVLVRSLLRREGIKVATGSTARFLKRIAVVSIPEDIQTEIGPLLAMLPPLNEQILALEDEIGQKAKANPATQILMTCPQIGSLTAAAFVATLDTAERFRRAHEVEAYIGLVPIEWSSSEVHRKGPITKSGNPRMRGLLVEAANRLMRYKVPETVALVDWAERIARRRGRGVAKVALARRLTGILWAMWRNKAVYDTAKVGGATRRAA